MAQRSIIIIFIIYYDIYIYGKIEVFRKESYVRGGEKPKQTPTPSPNHGPCMARASFFLPTQGIKTGEIYLIRMANRDSFLIHIVN
jgi:hypothetical protein